jgi:short-subunit dehydrogenase
MMRSGKRVVERGAVAIVTGASSGIGQAIASELASAGMRVYAIARSFPAFDPFAQPPPESGNQGFIQPVKADVTQEAGLSAAVSGIITREGRLDCLVQAAGYGIAGSVEDTAAHEARQQIATNFFGSCYALPPVIRQMRAQRSGLIVSLGSVAGSLPIPFQAYYSASKAALSALSLALGDELRPWGIRCLLVLPGDTRTDFTASRVMVRSAEESAYQSRCTCSVQKMAADEANGMDPRQVARGVVRKMSKRRPPLIYTPGIYNKAMVFLSRFFPMRFIRWVISRLYA